jgi:Glycosyltransferase family 87
VSARARATLGGGALVGLLAASFALAAAGAARPRSWYVPASIGGGFPGWLAGPLHGVGLTLSAQTGAVLLAVMFACYLVALACAGALPARWAIGGIVAVHVVFLLAPPLFSADVFGYIDYARLGVVHGLSPYSHGAAAAAHDPVTRFVRWHDIATPYGPVFTLASYPLAWVSVAVALWTLKAAAALLSLVCVALVWRIAARRGVAPLPAAMLVGLNPLLLAYGVGGAHNDFLLMALVLGAVALTLAGREAAGGLAIAAGIGVKATAGLVAPFLLLGAERRGRLLVGIAAGVVVVVLAGAIAFGADGLGFIHQIREQQHLVALYSVPRRLAAWLGFDHIPFALRIACGLVFGGSAVGLLLWTWRGGDWLVAAAWATLVLLLTTAWIVPWYVVWLLPLAAATAGRRLRLATLLLCTYIVLTRTIPILF